MKMTNEKDSFGVQTESAQSLQITGPFVVVTPNATTPDPRASAVFNATMRKDLESRQQGHAS